MGSPNEYDKSFKSKSPGLERLFGLDWSRWRLVIRQISADGIPFGVVSAQALLCRKGLTCVRQHD